VFASSFREARAMVTLVLVLLPPALLWVRYTFDASATNHQGAAST
jgi:hypothetical protein